MPLDPKRVQDVFLAAVEFHEPAARAAVLDRECSGDAELRQRVEALLRARDEPNSLLDQPIVKPEHQLFAPSGGSSSDPLRSYGMRLQPDDLECRRKAIRLHLGILSIRSRWNPVFS